MDPAKAMKKPVCILNANVVRAIKLKKKDLLGHYIWLTVTNTCLELGEVCRKVGLPPSVLNIVNGLGQEASAPLSSHPHVDKLVTLGLGGKSPIVVFEDVDLDKVKLFMICTGH